MQTLEKKLSRNFWKPFPCFFAKTFPRSKVELVYSPGPMEMATLLAGITKQTQNNS